MNTVQRLREMEWFAARVCESRYVLSEHVIRSLMARKISVPDIEAALQNGSVIEEHRHARRRVSYLVCDAGKPIHVLCAPDPIGWLIVTFAYIPAPPVWMDATRRNPRGEQSMAKPMQECFFCGGEIKQITVGNFDYRLEGQLYVIKKVPAGLCQQCGEKYIEAVVGRKMNALIEQKRFTGTEPVNFIDYE